MSNNLVHGDVLGPLYDFGLFYIVMLFLNPVKTLGSEMGHGIATQEDVAYHGLVTDWVEGLKVGRGIYLGKLVWDEVVAEVWDKTQAGIESYTKSLSI